MFSSADLNSLHFVDELSDALICGDIPGFQHAAESAAKSTVEAILLCSAAHLLQRAVCFVFLLLGVSADCAWHAAGCDCAAIVVAGLTSMIATSLAVAVAVAVGMSGSGGSNNGGVPKCTY